MVKCEYCGQEIGSGVCPHCITENPDDLNMGRAECEFLWFCGSCPPIPKKDREHCRFFGEFEDILNSPRFTKQYAKRVDLVEAIHRSKSMVDTVFYTRDIRGNSTKNELFVRLDHIVAAVDRLMREYPHIIRTHGLKAKEEKKCACGIYEDQGVTCWEHTRPELRDKCFPNGKPKEE